MKIGIFDSGLGGLTVLKEIVKMLPQYDYLYLGDNARTPYGGHSNQTIFQYSKQAVDYMFKNNCKLIIIACNTASAVALHKLQSEYLVKKYPKLDRRILGVIRPVVEYAAKISEKKIGLVGTRATINSKTYEQELKKIDGFKIYPQACPLLVPLIEEGWNEKPETASILKHYLVPLKKDGVETLILGCTHYPILIKQIRKIMGKNCKVLNTGKIVAHSLKKYLERHPEIERGLSKNKKRQYFTTDKAQRINQLANKFLSKKIKISQTSPF